MVNLELNQRAASRSRLIFSIGGHGLWVEIDGHPVPLVTIRIGLGCLLMYPSHGVYTTHRPVQFLPAGCVQFVVMELTEGDSLVIMLSYP